MPFFSGTYFLVNLKVGIIFIKLCFYYKFNAIPYSNHQYLTSKSVLITIKPQNIVKNTTRRRLWDTNIIFNSKINKINRLTSFARVDGNVKNLHGRDLTQPTTERDSTGVE